MTGGYVLVFDFGGTKTAVATANLAGDFICRDTFSTVEYGDGAGVLQQGIAVGQSLCAETQQLTGSALIAIGVSSMGITFPDRVEMAPNVPNWGQLCIEATIGRAFADVPIRIENDVKTATLAELRRGALRGSGSGLYLNLGTGVAIGHTFADQVVRGHNGAAGEIAYVLLERGKFQGYASGVTPFEDYVGGGGISRRATQQFGRTLSARDVFTLAQSDASIRAFRDDLLHVLAHHVTNSVIQWDPERVVVGGGMIVSKDAIFPLFTDYFAEFVPFPPVLQESAFQGNASLYGAVELALDIARASRKETLT